MKLIIAGSRSINPSVEFIDQHIRHGVITRVISGGARGVDLAGERWAESKGLPYVRFVPGWGFHGKKFAAFIRNHDMGFYADGLLAIWDGKSPGTRHMILTMRELGKPVKIVQWRAA